MPVGAIIGAGVLGAGATTYAANTAVGAQQSAANTASNTEKAALGQAQGDLTPYLNLGQNAATALAAETGTAPGTNPQTAPLTAPFAMTPAQLATMPGYQFQLQQGEESTQNGFASQGLASSGAAQKGGINYAEGLASTSFQQQFANYLQQNQQTANILQSQVNTGEGAGGAIAGATVNTGANIASNQIGAGNAAAAGANASGAAVSGALNNGASAIYQGNLLQQLLAQNNNTQYAVGGSGGTINGYGS